MSGSISTETKIQHIATRFNKPKNRNSVRRMRKKEAIQVRKIEEQVVKCPNCLHENCPSVDPRIIHIMKYRDEVIGEEEDTFRSKYQEIPDMITKSIDPAMHNLDEYIKMLPCLDAWKIQRGRWNTYRSLKDINLNRFLYLNTYCDHDEYLNKTVKIPGYNDIIVADFEGFISALVWLVPESASIEYGLKSRCSHTMTFFSIEYTYNEDIVSKVIFNGYVKTFKNKRDTETETRREEDNIFIYEVTFNRWCHQNKIDGYKVFTECWVSKINDWRKMPLKGSPLVKAARTKT